MTKTIKFAIATLMLAAVSFGQVTLSSTTLGAAISVNDRTITLASTSTMQNAGPVNQVNTAIYVDKELMAVQTVVDSTHVTVLRNTGSVGASTKMVAHANGAKVYFAITGNTGPAMSIIGSNLQTTSETAGSCQANTTKALPLIYLYNGDLYDCKRTGAAGTAGQWIFVGTGTMGTAGTRVTAFCTGTAGSGETEYLNGAACSGASTITYTSVIATAGTLANFYVYSSAVAVSGASDATTVYRNGSATAITCNLLAATTTCSDLVHSVAVVPGDVIAVQFVSHSGESAANISASVGLY